MPLPATRRRIRLVWVDAAYAGKLVAWAAARLGVRVDIVRRRLAHAFQVRSMTGVSSPASISSPTLRRSSWFTLAFSPYSF